MKRGICVVVSLLFLLVFVTEGFCRGGGSSGGGFSGGGRSSGSFSSSSGSKSSSGNYGSVKAASAKAGSQPTTGGVNGKSSIGDMSKSTGVKMNTSSYHSTPVPVVASPRSGRENDRLTTVAPPVAQSNDYIRYSYPTQTGNTTYFYRAYPQTVYTNGDSGIPTWFWIWWMTSNNNHTQYRHDQQSGMLVKETTNKETGQKTQSFADPEEFEEESSTALWFFLIFTTLAVAGVIGLLYAYWRWRQNKKERW